MHMPTMSRSDKYSSLYTQQAHDVEMTSVHCHFNVIHVPAGYFLTGEIKTTADLFDIETETKQTCTHLSDVP